MLALDCPPWQQYNRSCSVWRVLVEANSIRMIRLEQAYCSSVISGTEGVGEMCPW